MSRPTRTVAWACAGLTVLGVVVAAGLAVAAGGGVAILVAVVTFVTATTATGVVLVLRRPDHPIGWLLLGAGLAYSVGSVAVTCTEMAVARPGADPLLPLAVWAGDIAFAVGSVTCATWVPLLFPTGRLPSIRWWPAAVLPGCALALLVVEVVFGSGAFVGTGIDNPLDAGAGHVVTTVAGGGFALLLVVSVLLAATSLVARYRRATGIERLQLRWVAYSASMVVAVLAVVVVSGGGGGPSDDAENLATTAALALVPVSIGVAILRYRLYDIDRIISRTVTWALVTAVVGTTYALIAVVPSAVLALESDLLVAAATLAAAAVAVPVWQRVQSLVDRRFNRARFDAQRVADGYAAQVRGAVDLDRLTDDLTAVVAVTVQPTAIGVWLADRGA